VPEPSEQGVTGVWDREGVLSCSYRVVSKSIEVSGFVDNWDVKGKGNKRECGLEGTGEGGERKRG